MTAKDAIRRTAVMARFITKGALEDLSDAELLVRTSPAANHIAWQLGHLIVSEHRFLTNLGHAPPALPAGFAEAHSTASAGRDSPDQFARKDEYFELMERLRAAVLAALEATPDAALDEPGPEASRNYAPTVGDVFMLFGTHELMHSGQFVAVRRKLGKPILF